VTYFEQASSDGEDPIKPTRGKATTAKAKFTFGEEEGMIIPQILFLNLFESSSSQFCWKFNSYWTSKMKFSFDLAVQLN
jgi:hypothetical protein